jgi:biotin carboxyl carrier protein
MGETGLTSLEYSDDKMTLKLKRRVGGGGGRGEALAGQLRADSPADGADEERDGTVTVRSPMVGVFYSAPGEGRRPYVSLGDEVRAGDVLCIIEAMKMMNEITAERDGTVAEICASNRQTVDYGHPLFRLRPAPGADERRGRDDGGYDA